MRLVAALSASFTAIMGMYYLWKKEDRARRCNATNGLELWWLFPPEYVEVWGGSNKDDLKLLGSIIPTPAKKGEFSTLLELKVGFSPTSLKCIKTIAHSIPAIPKWQSYSRPPGWVFISEVIVD